MKETANKFACDECGWEGMSYNVKSAPNPFDKDEIILGCPRCKSVDSMIQLCEQDGCRQIATCGTPVNDEREYVRVCGDHYQRITEMDKQLKPVIRMRGDKQVKIEHDGYSLYLSVMRNGFQWTSISIDDEILSMIREVLDEYS